MKQLRYASMVACMLSACASGGTGEDAGVPVGADGGVDARIACTSNADCDDGIDCTRDLCGSVVGCRHEPDDSACPEGSACEAGEGCVVQPQCASDADCDDGVGCTVDTCDVATSVCSHAPDDAVCDDGLVCNGVEACDETGATPGDGCVDGTAVVCDDGDPCTTDMCNEPDGSCTSAGADADGDGYIAVGCGSGDDCDDLSPAVHPDALEVCDGVDNDCSGAADDAASMECALGSADVSCTTACGTAGARTCTATCTLTPCAAATETCNGCDDDGNGAADDGLACALGATRSCVTACGTPGTEACDASCSGYGACGGAEVCNGCDDDLNGSADDGFACPLGSSRSCVTACGTSGMQPCDATCSGYGACSAAEVCNGCDDDGDGIADDGFTCAAGSTRSCTTACGTSGAQSCNGSCSGYSSCAAAVETCGNGCDDDGNGLVDDGCGPPNDTCGGAILLSGASGTRSDAFGGATNTTDCASGSEIWYRLSLSRRSIVYIDTFGSTFDTKISIRSSCGAGYLQCEDDDCGVLQERLIRELPAGTYYVAAHAFSSFTTSGTVNLRWQTLTAGNGSATFISTAGRYSGSTSGTGVTSGTCAGSGPENLYYFAACPGTSATTTATTCSLSSYDTTLYLRRGGDTQIACNDDACGLQSSTSGAVSGPGLFGIYVDGWSSGSFGSYSVDIAGLP